MKLTVEMLYQRKEIFIAWNKFIFINLADKTTAGILAKSLSSDVKRRLN